MVLKNEESNTTKLYGVTEDKELYGYDIKKSDDGKY